jgi:hypothetical protein
MAGIGLECGRPNVSPRCNNLSKYPASILAPWENGGVFTSPRSQTIGLPASAFFSDRVCLPRYYMSDVTLCQYGPRLRPLKDRHGLTWKG